eukprot:2393181-Rhodomonas_salina.1
MLFRDHGSCSPPMTLKVCGFQFQGSRLPGFIIFKPEHEGSEFMACRPEGSGFTLSLAPSLGFSWRKAPRRSHAGPPYAISVPHIA